MERGENAILMIHGFTGVPSNLKTAIDFFSENEFTVYAPCLPGHGTSPEDLNRTKWTDWVSTVDKCYQELKEKEFKKIFVLGHSMGGTLTLRLGELYSNIDGLIPVAAPVKLKGFLLRLVPILKYFVKYVKKKPQKPHHYITESYDVWPVPAIHELLKLIKHTRRDLGNIISPTLIIQGTKDELVPLENLDIIYDGIRSKIKRRLILEDVDHGVFHSDKVDDVLNEILGFINELVK